jgi:hypothetical protein
MSEPEFSPGDRVRYTGAYLADLLQRDTKADPAQYVDRTGVVIDDACYREQTWTRGNVLVAWEDMVGTPCCPYYVAARALEVVPDEESVRS